eukprot:6074080-Prymnesium_polylepis.1
MLAVGQKAHPAHLARAAAGVSKAGHQRLAQTEDTQELVSTSRRRVSKARTRRPTSWHARSPSGLRLL